ncbi:MAG: hypothetical protein HOL98_14695 [Gammaproteobacteria bacterium]|nr:hypothetical protein [Gammaproteobacteria bacterium]MBT5204705.1 hypothetical protein [Gammaproteobacteria bacterium]MBT5602691.1 hypothetical protein [Gammaproteobacteria bacterium]MBT6246076.1 hypothetical protein [Gammaproteobacteria bacterium]
MKKPTLRIAGMSLVEVMISLTMGTIILIGVINLFSANSETYSLVQGQSRMQESARFAMGYLSKDIQKAGFRGCFTTNNVFLFTMYRGNDIPYEFDLRTGIQAYDGQAAGWLPAIAPLVPAYVAQTGINTAAIVATTDILTVRAASEVEAILSAPMALSSDPIVVTIPLSGLGFSDITDDLALIHDCEKSTMFEVTSIAVAGGQATIGHVIEADLAGQPRNSFAALAVNNSFNTDASVSAIDTITYFIAPGAGTNNEGNTPLALWRKMRTSAPVEMVEGVEDMQLLFGVDSDNDTIPNQYTTANLVADFNTVITVRISLTVNSIDTVGATQAPSLGCLGSGGLQDCISGQAYDGLLRRTFTSTVQLRN